jgi:two-component system response regulator FixJ
MTDNIVFVVDDDDAVRDSLAALLESEGHEVRAFASAEAFLAEVQNEMLGCVLADVRMSGMDGLQLQNRLSIEHAALPVILITGHGDITMAVKAMKAGAIDFIEKPFSDDVILDSVQRALTTGVKTHEHQSREANARRRIERLTQREREVLEELVTGNPNKVIAHNLGISPKTVEIHRARVMEKTQAGNLSQLVRMALAAGIDP